MRATLDTVSDVRDSCSHVGPNERHRRKQTWAWSCLTAAAVLGSVAAMTSLCVAAPEATKPAGKAPAADAKPADKAKPGDKAEPGDGAKAANGAKPDALAVLEASCVKCHGGREVKGGLDVTNREGLLLGSDSGVTVVPGKPAESLLIQVVKHEADPHMPPKGPKLSPESIATLSDWVKAGVPYARKVNRTPPADKGGADKGGADKGGAGGKGR